jgi:hypothetical protein
LTKKMIHDPAERSANSKSLTNRFWRYFLHLEAPQPLGFTSPSV